MVKNIVSEYYKHASDAYLGMVKRRNLVLELKTLILMKQNIDSVSYIRYIVKVYMYQ